jgi:hypothetical protein
MRKSLDYYAKEIRKLNVEKGWYDKTAEDRTPLINYALLHTEPAEASEEVRNHKDALYYGVGDKPLGIAIELIDLVIRVLDTLAEYNNLKFVVEYNEEQILLKGSELEAHALFHLLISEAMKHHMNNALLCEKAALEKIVFCVQIYFGRMKWNFEDLLVKKFNYNKGRAYRHGHKRY